MSPKISIIIPTYNYARFLPEAIESVLKQTYKDYEIIVVDDGSTDNTKEIIDKYKDKIRYIYQENKGLPSARNTGIKSAKGEYFAFLDSDDVFLPEKLELQIGRFDRNSSLGMVYTYRCFFNEKGVRKKSISENRFLVGKIQTELFLGNVIPVSSTVVNRKCFEKVGLFDESLTSAEDYDLWLRLSHYFEVDCVPMPLVKIRLHSSNMSRNLERMYINKITVINKNIQMFPEVGYSDPHIMRRLADLYYSLGWVYVGKLKLKKAFKQFIKSIKARPLWLTPLVCLYYKILKLFK